MPTNWEPAAVFVCSTFVDMQHERDYLRDVVFPELAERLRSQQRYLETVDLRWGVDTLPLEDEQERELLVLRVCLAEVERTRPFFVALLGDRYGWRPEAKRLQEAAEEAGFEGDLREKSVTALEIEYGVLHDPERLGRCHFFLRDPLPKDAMTAASQARYLETDPAAEGELELLKERIKARVPAERVHRYGAKWDEQKQAITDLEELGRLVLDSLGQDLEDEDRQTRLAAQTPDPERWALDEFLASHRRGFCGRRHLVRELVRQFTAPAESDAHKGVCLTGTPGSGKSAVLARAERVLSRVGVMVLAHSAGMSSTAPSVEAMLRRWCEDLARSAGGAPPPATASRTELEEAFADLLRRAAQSRRVVLLLDAVNQMEATPRATYLTWLPDPWPANAGLLVTTIPGPEADLLARRQNLRLRELPPLEPSEAEEIIVRVCDGYHRHIHPDVVQALLSKTCGSQPAASNPLWLQLAVERLNRLDADDFARLQTDRQGRDDERLHRLLLAVVEALPSTAEEVFDWVQDRVEALLGEQGGQWARTCLGLLALGRGGWREADLRELLDKLTGRPWSALHFARLRRACLGHVVQRSLYGEWTFRHEQGRQSVLRRNLKTPASRRHFHCELASHLEALPASDPLRVEIMYHLASARATARAAKYYAGEFTSAVEQNAASTMLANCAHAPATPWTTGGVAWVCSLLDVEELPETTRGRLAERYAGPLAEALEREADLTALRGVLEPTRESLRSLVRGTGVATSWRGAFGMCLRKLGDCLADEGALPAATNSYVEGRDVYEALTRLEPSERQWERETAVCVSRLGDTAMQQGALAEAREHYHRYIQIIRDLLSQAGEDVGLRRDLSVGHEKLGYLERRDNHLAVALDHHRSCSAILEKLVAEVEGNTQWHRELAISAAVCGDVYAAQGRFSDACDAYLQAQERTERLLATDPTNLTWQDDLAGHLERLAEVWRRQGKLSEAGQTLHDALELRLAIVAKDPAHGRWSSDLGVTQNTAARLALERGQRVWALELYQSSLALARQWAERDPSNARWQRQLAATHAEMATACLVTGDAESAAEHYAAQDQLLTALRPAAFDAVWWQDMSRAKQAQAALCRRQGDLAGARERQEQGVALLERLVAGDADNAQWREELACARRGLGEVLWELGNLPGAWANHEAALAALEETAAEAPESLSARHEVSIQQERMGDLLLELGRTDDATACYSAALSVREALCQSTEQNRRWTRDLALSHMRLGDMRLREADAEGAQDYFIASRAAIERLANEDQEDVNCRRDLAVAEGKVGDAARELGDWPRAFDSYRRCLRLGAELASRDRENVEWQRDVAVGHERLGGALEAHGEGAAAVAEYESAAGVLEGLRARDDRCAIWPRDLALLYHRTGFLHARLRNPDPAYALLRRSRDLWRDMVNKGQFLPPRQLQMMSELESFLGPD